MEEYYKREELETQTSKSNDLSRALYEMSETKPRHGITGQIPAMDNQVIVPRIMEPSGRLWLTIATRFLFLAR